MKVNILEAKNKLSLLIRSAQAGEEIVIANRGVPVARLVPCGSRSPADTREPGSQARRREGPGTGRAVVDWLRKHRLPERLRRTSAEVDRAIAEERAGWD